jgi:hypothetical protein
MTGDELTPETARELMSPLERGTLFVVDKDERDRILAQWTADRARLATVTAQRDALVPLARYGLTDSAVWTAAERVAARAALTAIDAEAARLEADPAREREIVLELALRVVANDCLDPRWQEHAETALAFTPEAPDAK